MSETITTEKKGHVLVIGLNRAAKLNSFNLEMLGALAEAYSLYEEDTDAWCALLYGRGDNFTSGLDLAQVGPAVASGQPLFPVESVDPFGLMGRRRTKPVVIAVQGWCLTIGVELCLASDVRIASSDTRFAQMEVKRGILPFGGATLRFPQIAGWGNAMMHLLTGDEFDAQEAHRIGLVQQVVQPGEQFERGMHFAETIAKRAPLAVQATLESCSTSVHSGSEAALGKLMDHAKTLIGSEDAMEGVMSFVERRDARFKGR